jgi:hypothetical protein
MHPNLAAIDTADVALIVAIAGALVVLVGLLVQLHLHRLAGPRLVVRLRPALWRAPGELQRGTSLERVHHPARGLVDPDGAWAELALVDVVNVGRSPAAVSDIALDLGRVRWWWPWSRNTLTARPITLFEAVAVRPVERLEPGGALTVLYALRPPGDLRRYSSGKVTVRATARSVGHRPRRSPWRERWRVETGRSTWWMPQPGPNALAFQELFAAYAPHDPDGVYAAWLEVAEALDGDRPDIARVRELLTPAAGVLRAIASADRITELVRPTKIGGVTLEF